MNRIKNELTQQEKSQLLEYSEKLKAQFSSNNKNEIQLNIDQLNKISKPMVERAMNRTISTALKDRSIND